MRPSSASSPSAMVSPTYTRRVGPRPATIAFAAEVFSPMCSSRISLTGTPLSRTVAHSSSAIGPSDSGSLFMNSGSSSTGNSTDSATDTTIAPPHAGTGHQFGHSRPRPSRPSAIRPPSTRPIARALAWSANQPPVVCRDRPLRRDSTSPA